MPNRFILAHGFTQSHHLWRVPVAAILAEYRRHNAPPPTICAVDLPGHGHSEPPSSPGLDIAARRLLRAGGRGTYMGYSLGGRLALWAAVIDATAEQTTMQRLVLIGATAGIADEAERSARVASDESLAQRIEQVGLDTFLTEWLALPLFARLTAEQNGIEYRRRNTAPGLAASLRYHGVGQQRPLWDQLDQIQIPVLIVVGQHDDKFTALAHRLANAISGAELAVIPNASHSAHLEQPAGFATTLHTWLHS